jgi:YidC/Oxa1 family membrane protein insertase
MDTKNVILATALSVGILLLWSFYFEPPVVPQESIQQTDTANSNSNLGLGTLDEELKIIEEPEMLSVEDSISDSPRIEINTPKISGSIRLNGLL